MKRTSPEKPWLHIESLADLKEHDEDIVARIAEMFNGGSLFMANPLRLLADIGVTMSADAKNDFVRSAPQLEAVSDAVYDAIQASPYEQSVRVHVRSVLPRRNR